MTTRDALMVTRRLETTSFTAVPTALYALGPQLEGKAIAGVVYGGGHRYTSFIELPVGFL